MVVSRFDVCLVSLDPTQGHEIHKTRPCVILSPDEMNAHIGTVIVAPMTTKGRDYPTRIPLTFRRKKGQLVLDQIRTVDKTRLVKRLGKLDQSAATRTLTVLQELFAQ
ncbi:MAG: type II toxin-antitoxin system PemK/MazF family toxin [Acidiferrobacteraceae bacterium]